MKIILRGLPVSRGKTQGLVKIISGDTFNEKKIIKQLLNINDGDIIVTQMTRPLFMIAINKASAIITDVGGLLCHAAIVSRELNIPCIVNTKVATKILRNGQSVVVDGAKGLIYGK